MLTEQSWFTEIEQKNKFAISFKIKEKLHEEQSQFQEIVVYDTEGFGKLMVVDGFIMLTQRDNFLYHEMMSHPVLFTHHNPKNVAIIGGGDCGVLQQVLKHKTIEQVTQIDIDKRITDLAKIYFPELCTNNNDPRAKLLFADGIEWIKKVENNSLDVIIVDSTDPIGPATGLFNKDFYHSCLLALKEDGILVHQSESPLFHQKLFLSMQEAMFAAEFTHVQPITFPQPCYVSGYWSATMATRRIQDLTEFRSSESKYKNFTTKYYNNSIHAASLAIPEYLGLRSDVF